MVAIADASARSRFAWLDLARGYALVAMAVYHFVWDLSLFGLVSPDTPFEPHWKLLARATAASFLGLAGVGLAIAHGRGIRWPAFGRRLATILLAAGAITLATRVAMPDAYIFFGILHMIALGSAVGLLLVPLHWSIAFAAAAIAGYVGLSVEAPFFNEPWLWWTGLGTERRVSNDFVPFFPAFAAVAIGVGTAKLLRLDERRSGGVPLRANGLHRPLAWAGRHSLLVYLVHQPVLIGLLYAVLSVRRLLV